MVKLVPWSSGEPRKQVYHRPGKLGLGSHGETKTDPKFPAGLPQWGSLLCCFLDAFMCIVLTSVSP